jgi:hypothetical protein
MSCEGSGCGIVTSMESLASYCLTGPDSGSDAGSLATCATPVEGGWLLRGSKAFMSGAGVGLYYLRFFPMILFCFDCAVYVILLYL